MIVGAMMGLRGTMIKAGLVAGFLAPGLAVAQTTGTGSYVPPGNYLPTPVPPTPTLLGAYADDSAGSFESVDAWLGRPLDFTSIHTGQASESDFIISVDYVLWSSRYTGLNAAGVADSRLVSVPLIWSGATLSAAAAGAYNADYATVAQKILNDIPAGPAPGQSVIYLRTGWEENLAGEMPWSSTGQEAQFIAAFQQFVGVFRSVDTTGRFRFVWCPNVGGDPIQNSYPGDGYVDVVSMDFYYALNELTNAPDPDAAFQEMLSQGLDAAAGLATAHGKPLAFSEWGVDADNFGNYVKDFTDWCRAQGCLYVSYWDSDGSYAGELSDGSYPQTGAMFRHLWNPQLYPVEPIAAPVGVAALAGNASNLITANPVTSSTKVTRYTLYKGPASGAESTIPVASSATPSFTDAQPNGAAAFYRVGAGNALSQGYLSAEVSATPHAASALPLPSHYLAVPGTGWASSATPALTALSQASPALNTASLLALVAPQSGPGLLAGFPGGVSLSLGATGQLVGYSRDWFSNRYTATSTLPVPFPADGHTPEWVRVDIDAKGAVTTFYVAPVAGITVPSLTGSAWSQLGAPQTGQNHNGIYDAAAEPFYAGGSPEGAGQLVGAVYDVLFYANGVLATHPRFDGRASGARRFEDMQARVWSLAGGAVIQ